MSDLCPPLNEENSENNEFEPICGTNVFKTIYTSWYNINSKYLNYINNINDPILKYISVYFVQHYIYGYKYFGNSKNHHRSEACSYLNEWLLEKRDLFTFGIKCPKKLNSWNKNFETLWKMLTEDLNYFNKENKTWCYDYKKSKDTNFPSGLTLPICDEIISEKNCSEVHLTPPPEKDCRCPENVVPANTPHRDESPDIQPTRKIAVTSGLTTAGTIGTLLLLYKYTPVSSWFRRRGMNNVGTDLYMNPGGADAFLRMQHDDGGNNLFYHPSV